MAKSTDRNLQLSISFLRSGLTRLKGQWRAGTCWGPEFLVHSMAGSRHSEGAEDDHWFHFADSCVSYTFQGKEVARAGTTGQHRDAEWAGMANGPREGQHKLEE